MTTTFKKRQKEMKRQDKARSKAEKRLQKKTEPGVEVIGNDGIEPRRQRRARLGNALPVIGGCA